MIVTIIPARMESSRLPGKVLLPVGGKPLIQWTIEAALRADLGSVVLASDSPAVIAWARQFNEKYGTLCVIATPPASCGTERCCRAMLRFPMQFPGEDVPEAIINLQADEPLIDPKHLQQLAAQINAFPRCDIATLTTSLVDADQDNRNIVKVRAGMYGFAERFTRQRCPSARRHVGVYGFPVGGLQWFAGLKRLDSENLEQNRAMAVGARIRLVDVDHPHYGVDTQEQYDQLCAVMNADGA